MGFLRIDHVQITVPWAREREARHFYGTVLGLREVDRPEALQAAVLYFAFGESSQLHVVLMHNPFRPPLSDHFAVAVENMTEVKKRLTDHNICYHPSPVRDGRERIFVQDPFGNKMEFVGPANGSWPRLGQEAM